MNIISVEINTSLIMMREWCVTLKLQNSAGGAEVSSESLRADKLPPATVHLSCAPAPPSKLLSIFFIQTRKKLDRKLDLSCGGRKIESKYLSNLNWNLQKIFD